MVAVLNKRWLSKGWHVMSPEDSEIMALAFIERLNQYAIPHRHYFELFCRSVDLRVRRISQGLNVDDFSADMMAACWTGENGLKAELKRREVERGRTLTSNAESQCGHCFGTGYKTITQGSYTGTVKCDHGNGGEAKGGDGSPW